ncbi:DUF2892 domain-containing protein [Flavobacterium sp.]|uniref:YgaP family membrane protein n=1 Tax=Flavobacterium sp. TaxID=239 RepID=UPI001B3D9158|nr:DUF2892 domain-containing protein [Flavobacterium sp.]MBP6180739.1 DUF2892 domain-containing protein [Flavobacterium sp.]
MKKNMGSTDRIIRIAIVAIVAVLYLTDIISGTFAIVLGAFAVILLITSFVSFCPLYTPFNLSTRKKI